MCSKLKSTEISMEAVAVRCGKRPMKTVRQLYLGDADVAEAVEVEEGY